MNHLLSAFLVSFFGSYLLFIVLFIFCVVVPLTSFFTYKYFRGKMLWQKQLALLTAEKENAVMAAQLEMQEHTFREISGEVHDNIGQQLCVVLRDVESAETSGTPLMGTSDTLRTAIGDLRDLSHSLSAERIRDEGLEASIKKDAARITAQGKIKLETLVMGVWQRIDSGTQILLYRIYQEAVQNIIKHAKATNAVVSMDWSPDFLQMIIFDNGTGITPGQKRGHGLNNMARRVKALGGKFNILSQGNGTYLMIEIPLRP